MRIETQRFSWKDPQARQFFLQNGYVIITDALRNTERADVQCGWDILVNSAARQFNLTNENFVRKFPQNRDLWRKEALFYNLLFKTPQATIAQYFLQVSGVRLFHDHAIAKPVEYSAPIPWHQDSAYWPLDRVGISLWTPVRDVSVDGGCLKVLAGSHHDGPSKPQDFLASDPVHYDADPRLVHLPVADGETVVLHGLTWHGSNANTSHIPRLAYLTLWVPATSRFTPAHAEWHPTASKVGVPAGQRLEGEWFPLFGIITEQDEGTYVQFAPPQKVDGPSMFSASQDIAEHIAWLLSLPIAPIAQLLEPNGKENIIENIIKKACAAGLILCHQCDELGEILKQLQLQDEVRRTSVARDVYLTAATAWWRLIGSAIHEAKNAS